MKLPLPTTKPIKNLLDSISTQPSPKRWAYEDGLPEPTSPPSIWRKLLYFSGGLILTVIIASIVAVGISGTYFYQSNMIMPGVYVGDILLGGLTAPEAATILEEKWQTQQIILETDSNQQAVTAEQLGLTLDFTSTAQLAYRQGRSPETLLDIIKNGGRAQLTPIWLFEADQARHNLEAMAPEFEKAAVNAGLRSVQGQVEAVPAINGHKLDIQATVTRLAHDPSQVINERRLVLEIQPLYPALTDVSDVVDQANQMLAHDLFIRAYDPIADETFTWTVSPDEWSFWVNFEAQAGDPAQLDWEINETNLQTYLDGQAVTLDEGRYLQRDEVMMALSEALESQTWYLQLRVYHPEQSHTVQPGETLSSIGYDYGVPYPWLEQANPHVDKLSPGQVITIPSPDALIPLPIVENKRLVISISQQKMWAYENGALKWEWLTSTGINSSPTSPGVFQIQTHEENAYAANWNLWMPYFMGIYRPVPTSDFMNGFHGFPTRGSSTLLWTNDLGRPVTYGCLLLDNDNAALLFDWAEKGVIVEIQK